MAWAERKRPPQTRTGVRGSTEWRQKPRHGSFPQSPVASPSLLSAAAPPSSLLALGARSALAAPCFLLRGGLRREATGAVWAGLHSAFQTRPSLPPLPRPAHSLPSTPPTTSPEAARRPRTGATESAAARAGSQVDKKQRRRTRGGSTGLLPPPGAKKTEALPFGVRSSRRLEQRPANLLRALWLLGRIPAPRFAHGVPSRFSRPVGPDCQQRVREASAREAPEEDLARLGEYR